MLNILKVEDSVVVGFKKVKSGYTLETNEFLVESADFSLLGKLYNSETGDFTDPENLVETEARQWRDSELERTDILAVLPDYPNKEALLTYRQALRDWTDTEDFPETRPTLGE